jgi:superfamily II DNA or RNA helicase
MQYILYIVTSPYYLLHQIVKLGLSTDLYGRGGTYQTGCPPGFDPSHELEFIAAWTTDATTDSKLKNYEAILHNQFAHLRMKRTTGRLTEWFKFPVGVDPIAAISTFLSHCAWITSIVDLEFIRPKKRQQNYLNTSYHRNINFCEDDTERTALINAIQAPVIRAIQTFITSAILAGTILAPCGSGKTRMACEGMRGLQRVIICVPLQQIQQQWADTLLSLGIGSIDQILLIGGKGTTDTTVIAEWMKKSSYFILTTYASSHLLIEALTSNVQLIVLDEAHHMAGVVATADTGEGRTRRLMKKACDLKIKRLSLTFTPRNVRAEEVSSVLTMDDEEIFGSILAEIKLRDLIRKGLLPDYRLWSLRDATNKGKGIEAKINTIIEACAATEEFNGEEKHLLHHIVLFVHTTTDAAAAATILKKVLLDIEIFHVGSDASCDNYDDAIKAYNKAKRAILINCKMLGEGVDLPITNGVAILYPKQAVGDIVQTIFRAGRWHKDKPLFHILLPILEEDDMSGLESVFLSLAEYDEALKDELMYKAAHSTGESIIPRTDPSGSVIPDSILMEGFDGSNLEEVIRCFRNIRMYFYREKVLSNEEVVAICKKYSIATSEEYKTIRDTKEPHLPENPLRGITWYNFLHGSEGPMSKEQFVNDIIMERKIRTVADWMTTHTPPYPSSLNIADGYFSGIHEFQQLVALASIRSRR